MAAAAGPGISHRPRPVHERLRVREGISHPITRNLDMFCQREGIKSSKNIRTHDRSALICKVDIVSVVMQILIHVCMYIYIYIYTHTSRERERE